MQECVKVAQIVRFSGRHSSMIPGFFLVEFPGKIIYIIRVYVFIYLPHDQKDFQHPRRIYSSF